MSSLLRGCAIGFLGALLRDAYGFWPAAAAVFVSFLLLAIAEVLEDE